MMTPRSFPLLPALLLSLCLPAAVCAADTSAAWRTRVSALDTENYNNADILEEVRFGKEIAARILGRYKLVDDQKLQRYVNRVGAVVAQQTCRSELTFHFAVIESSEINAYSTPGGYIFVTSAAVKLMRDEAELAGVLAHELAHVCERHIVTELNLRGRDESGVSSLVALIGGASDSAKVAFNQSVEKAIDLVLRDGYKREDEMRADEDALLYVAMSGYDPAGLDSYLLRVSTTKAEVGKTYPRYDTRRQLLQKVAADHGVVSGSGRRDAARFSGATQVLQ